MHPDLAELFDEIIPYQTKYLHNLVTIVDDDDLKKAGQWSNETLQERFDKSKDDVKRASVPLGWEVSPSKESAESPVTMIASSD